MAVVRPAALPPDSAASPDDRVVIDRLGDTTRSITVPDLIRSGPDATASASGLMPPTSLIKLNALPDPATLDSTLTGLAADVDGKADDTLANVVPATGRAALGVPSTAEADAIADAAVDDLSYKELGITRAPSDGTAGDAQFGIDLADWVTKCTTTWGAQYASVTSRPLTIGPGYVKLNTSTLITTPGTAAVIKGLGANARISGAGIVLDDFRTELRDLMLMGAPVGTHDSTAVRVTTNGRRQTTIENVRIKDKTIGLSIEDSGGQDNMANVVIEKCDYPLRLYYGDNMQFANIDLVSSNSGTTADWYNGQGCKTVNMRGTGRLWLRGGADSSCVENYFVGSTFTVTPRRTIKGISIASAAAGAQTEVTVATKVASTLSQRVVSIFIFGTPITGAFCRLSVTGGSGNLTSLMAGATELLAGTVTYTTSAANTAALIAASINAGTGTHGYSATSSSSTYTIFAPVGTAANGTVLTRTGTLAHSGASIAAIDFGVTDHGLVVGDYVEFKPDVGTTWAGQERVQAVESSKIVLVQVDYTGAGVVGKAWKPHMLIKEQGSINHTHTGSLAGELAIASEVTDTTITLATPFASFPTPTDWGVTVPGWDVVFQSMNGGNISVNDIFFIGGNYNHILFDSCFNVVVEGARWKQRIHFIKRMDPLYQSARVAINTVGRGRNADAFTDIAISGAATGWTSTTYRDSNGDLTTPTDGYRCISSPNRDLPLDGGKPQLTETRFYENRKEIWIGGRMVWKADATGVTAGDLKTNATVGAVVTGTITGSASSTAYLTLKQEGATGGIHVRSGANGIAFHDAAANPQVLIRNASPAATQYIDMVGASTASGPGITAAGLAVTNVPLRITAKGDSSVVMGSSMRPANSTIGTLPTAATAGDGAIMRATDGSPPTANNRLVYVEGGVWRWLSNASPV